MKDNDVIGFLLIGSPFLLGAVAAGLVSALAVKKHRWDVLAFGLTGLWLFTALIVTIAMIVGRTIGQAGTLNDDIVVALVTPLPVYVPACLVAMIAMRFRFRPVMATIGTALAGAAGSLLAVPAALITYVALTGDGL